ncbi:hypothetical protein ACJ5H2_00315 [Nocardioides sp. R1-1]|uniref:hypothetical protein n=1 Tax=Nocardioides sp. R1-1 TaxID=3383502 RepID=UPI0038D1014F
MAQDTTTPSTRESDRPAVHHFIRLIGRAPTDEELAQFRDLGARRDAARRLRLRHRAARLIVRL